MQRLKAWAEPLTDTADSALAKALDAAEAHRETLGPADPDPAPPSRPSAHRSPELPEEAFREPLLEVIYERGGSAQGRELYPALRERMRRYSTPGDAGRAESGDERWRQTVKTTHDQLVREGYLRDDSPRGVWALSKTGVALVESRHSQPSGTFVDHLLAFPEVGEESDFDQTRSGPRPFET